MKADRSLTYGLATELRAIPPSVRRKLLDSNRNLAVLAKKWPSDLAIAYHFDCHRQLLRTPQVPEFIAFLLTAEARAKRNFLTYIRSGRSEASESPDDLRLRAMGCTLLLDGLSAMFGADLKVEDTEEDYFVFAYEDILRALDSKIMPSEESLLDVIPRSLPIYRQFMTAELSEEGFQVWATACVESIRLVVANWLVPLPDIEEDQNNGDFADEGSDSRDTS
jgi:hypothetical protein